jgi:hypothetical protein
MIEGVLMAKRKKKDKKFEFSKIILALVIASYFVGLGFGMLIIWKILSTGNVMYISTALCGLFSYIGAPVAVAIGFYSNKAKAENIEKIKITEGNKINNDFKLPLN